jgi:hypothetical protein
MTLRIDTAAPKRHPAIEETEAQFQRKVRQLATLTGWRSYHTRDSRRSDPGFPDLVLVNAKQARTIFAELKTQTGRLTEHQKLWLASLADAGQETALWRPADLDDIKQILLGRRIPTAPKEANTR